MRGGHQVHWKPGARPVTTELTLYQIFGRAHGSTYSQAQRPPKHPSHLSLIYNNIPIMVPGSLGDLEAQSACHDPKAVHAHDPMCAAAMRHGQDAFPQPHASTAPIPALCNPC